MGTRDHPIKGTQPAVRRIMNPIIRLPFALVLPLLLLVSATSAGAQALDYARFKSSVEPIFLKKRAGHTRCVVCHSDRSNNLLKLEKLAPGAKGWSEEQSRKNFEAGWRLAGGAKGGGEGQSGKNFEAVSALVVAGNPGSSLLLLHPLAPEAGGDAYHSGGRQFENRDDPDWKAIARWVGGS